MTKRFLAKKEFEDEEYGPLSYGYVRHKKDKNDFEDGSENDKEKEGYMPQGNDNDGLDKEGNWYHDRDYGN
jgi:hypothetical protein